MKKKITKKAQEAMMTLADNIKTQTHMVQRCLGNNHYEEARKYLDEIMACQQELDCYLVDIKVHGSIEVLYPKRKSL